MARHTHSHFEIILGIICFCTSPQAVSKRLPFSEIHRDTNVSQWFVENKLERTSAWGCLRALLCQIESLGITNAASRCQLPADVIARPLTSLEERVVDEVGDSHVLCAGILTPMFPDGFRVSQMLVVSNVLDRGSSGNAMVNFASAGPPQLTWCARFGEMHDSWNAVRAAAKGSGGIVWRSVVRMAAVQNLPYGPFRSGAWGRQMQEVHHTLTEELDANSPAFRECVDRQSEVDRLRYGGTGDLTQWWSYFGRLPACVRAPEVLKFARWFSVSSCWRQLKPDIFFLRLVVLRMKNSDVSTSVAETTAAWNAEVLDAKGQKGGLLQRIPGYINQELCDCMDIFCLSTRAIRRQCSSRLVDVKSPQAAIDTMVADTDAAQEPIIIDTIKALYGPEVHELCGPEVSETRAARNMKILLNMTMQTAQELLVRAWPGSCQFPGTTVSVLRETDKEALVWCGYLAYDWNLLLAWEAQAATGSINHLRVLDALTWRHQPLARVFYALCDRAHRNPEHLPEVRELALSINQRFLDEKVPEDCHQHVRDLSRGQRAKRARLLTAFDAVIRSHVLEDRKSGLHVSVTSDQEVASRSWHHASAKIPRDALRQSPLDFPLVCNQILGPTREWSSPTVPTLHKSCMAFHWMREHDTCEANRQYQYDASCWSRLLVPHTMAVAPEGELFYVLDSCDWGANLLWLKDYGRTAPGSVYELGHHVDALRLGFVLDPLRWVCWDIQEVFVKGLGVCVKRSGEPLTALQFALSHRYNLPQWLQHRALSMLMCELPNDKSHFDVKGLALLQLLVREAFKDLPHLVESVLEGYRKPPEAEDEDWDEEYLELLEEMAVQDQTNSAELESLKKDRTRKRNQKVMDRKKAFSREHEQQTTAKADRRRAKLAAAKKRKTEKTAKATVRRGGRRWSRAPVPAAAVPEPSVPQPPAPDENGAVAQQGDGAEVVGGHRAPTKVGGWEVYETRHGWLKYNSVHGSCDAHCRYHDKCKCDRTLRRKSLGLSLAWLAAGSEPDCTRDMHMVAKEVVSSESCYDQRRAERAAFKSAAVSDPHARAILDLEAAVCGETSVREPKFLPCKSIVALLRTAA